MSNVFRNVCFTIFTPEWDHAVLSSEFIVRAVVQKEKCPETNREHFQGFMCLKTPSRLGRVKELLNCESAHVEKAKGSPTQAWEYCTKEETRIDGPWKYGQIPEGRGKR
jgi:hypothetical protein